MRALECGTDSARGTMLSDKRREQRYQLASEAIVERKTGEQLIALTLNVSGSGVLLSLPNSGLLMGEEVRCGIRLYQGKPPQSWGTGRVVRLDDACVAIDCETSDTNCSEPSVAIIF